MIDPLTPDSEKHKLIDKAKRLGLEIYRREYNSFKIKCGVGINLKDEVIKPLLDAAYGDEFEKKINNKVAIVTGAGSGIGKAVALGLAREGVDTYLAGRKKDKLLTTKQISIKENNEGICHVIKCDVSKETDVRKMFMLIQKHHGRLDLLFNNAGIGLEANTIDKIKFKDWKKVIDTNINGMFLCAKYAYQLMKKQRPKEEELLIMDQFLHLLLDLELLLILPQNMQLQD